MFHGKQSHNERKQTFGTKLSEASCLITNSCVRKYAQDNGVCVVYGKETETITYILLECDCDGETP